MTETCEAHDNRRRPIRWSEFVAMLKKERVQPEKRILGGFYLAKRHNNTLYYHPTWLLFLQAFFGMSFAYVCWGLPKRGRFLRTLLLFRLRVILRCAKIVIVHDHVTGRYLKLKWGIRTIWLPYPVDVEYFGCCMKPREDFILVLGDNDRDEEYVKLLAQRLTSVKIIRVVNCLRLGGELRGQYELYTSVRVLVSIPDPTVRELLQRATAVLIPIRRTTHAAGLSTAMEAWAAGACVLTNSLRITLVGRLLGMPVEKLPPPERLPHRLPNCCRPDSSRVMASINQCDVKNLRKRYLYILENTSNNLCYNRLLRV